MLKELPMVLLTRMVGGGKLHIWFETLSKSVRF